MRLFKISCLSSCGTFFGDYLQHVLVQAHTEQEACETVEAWLDTTGRDFIRQRDGWNIEDMGEVPATPSVLDWHEASDY